MTGFEVDPSRLSSSGSALRGVSERLAAELAAFRSELAGYGAPWGSDDIGSLIGAAHDEVSSYAFECYQDALDEIAAAGADVVEIGLRYAEVDDAVGRRFGELGG
ncbi:hypothetical protein ACQPZX_11875 [Actinoplanes sp. CA-142083]|uniref:hypothetical protein n=1 Tax=Actinoplanes sp. CA-142083 TaxID=3239903 RepID=UPI003D89D5CC